MRLACLFFVLACVGCGGVQRAVVGAPVTAATVDVVDVGRDAVIASPRGALVRAEGSRVDVGHGTLFVSFQSHVRTFRGRFVVDEHDPRRGRIVIDFDLTTFENANRFVTMTLQYEFLEVDAHPTARFEGHFVPTGKDGACHVTGTLDLHGIKRPIAFDGKMTKEGGGDLHFETTFDLDRKLWDIRQHDEWDWINKDDFRLHLDLRGTPEHVVAEELP